MPRPPTLVFYVSGHGFGHASRDIEVINALRRAHPQWRVVVRTGAPLWFFDSALEAPVEWQPTECDTGIVQIDSLHVDVEDTLRRAAAFHDSLDDRARADAAQPWLASAALVAGDIPPLACAAAHAAGVPCMMLGNFSWDWIYEGYEETLSLAPRLLETIRAAYSRANGALRLPLHGGFGPFRRVLDVPFIARRARRDAADVRGRLGLPHGSLLVLASFGGYGLRGFDLAQLGRLEGWTVVITSDMSAARRSGDTPPGVPAARLPAVVRCVDEATLRAADCSYGDLVGAVDVVATKPGYGIIAECAANGTGILYTSRGRFREYDVLVQEMPAYVRAQFIAADEMIAGRWQRALDALIAQPAPPRPAETSGADVVAEILASFA